MVAVKAMSSEGKHQDSRTVLTLLLASAHIEEELQNVVFALSTITRWETKTYSYGEVGLASVDQHIW